MVENLIKARKIQVTSWDEFLVHLRDLREQISRLPGRSPLLFRGQANANWKLMSTLDRVGADPMSLAEYYRLATRVKTEIESATGTTWSGVPDYGLSIETSLRDFWGVHDYPPNGAYGYMVYLRHHGFPSPFLDWSRSPYIAAYFAYSVAGDFDRAIYLYCEMPLGGKSRSSGVPYITGKGPYVRGPRRHFLQQSDYTICAVFEEQWRFTPHEEIYLQDSPDQDYFWKFTLPASERGKVLTLLDEHNLNAFSLFGSDESLMETLWFRSRGISETRASQSDER